MSDNRSSVFIRSRVAELVVVDEDGAVRSPLRKYSLGARLVVGSSVQADIKLKSESAPPEICVLIGYPSSDQSQPPTYHLMKLSESFDVFVNGETVPSTELGLELKENDVIGIGESIRVRLRFTDSANPPIPKVSPAKDLSWLNTTVESGLLEQESAEVGSEKKEDRQSLPECTSDQKYPDAPVRKFPHSKAPQPRDSIVESPDVSVSQILETSMRKVPAGIADAVDEARKICSDPLERRVLNTPSGILRFAKEVEEIAAKSMIIDESGCGEAASRNKSIVAAANPNESILESGGDGLRDLAAMMLTSSVNDFAPSRSCMISKQEFNRSIRASVRQASLKRHMSIGLTSTPKRRLSNELATGTCSGVRQQPPLMRSTTAPVPSRTSCRFSAQHDSNAGDLAQIATQSLQTKESSNQHISSIRMFPHNDSIPLLRAGHRSMETEAKRKIVEKADQELNDLLDDVSVASSHDEVVDDGQTQEDPDKDFNVERNFSPIPKSSVPKEDEEEAAPEKPVEEQKEEIIVKKKPPKRSAKAKTPASRNTRTSQREKRNNNNTKTPETKAPPKRVSVQNTVISQVSNSTVTSKTQRSKRNAPPLPSVHRMVTRSAAAAKK